MDTDEQVKVVTDAVSDVLGSFVGRPMNASTTQTIVVRLREIMKRYAPSLGGQMATWELLRAWVASQGGDLHPNGELYIDGVLAGTIARESVKQNIQVRANPDDPTALSIQLFDYTLKAAHPIDAEEFEEMHGRAPVQDDLDRINCPIIGEAGHWCCGVCPKHNKARFVCGCLAMEKT